MNKNQAKVALAKGERLTHTYFTDEEWVQGDGYMYIFEDGCRCDPDEFWRYREDSGFDEGWRIWEEPIESGEVICQDGKICVFPPSLKAKVKKITDNLFKTDTYKFESKHEKPWYLKGRW